jgi:hypothetical protein
MTREQLEAKLAQNPRFRIVRESGKGFVIVAGTAGTHLVEPKPSDTRRDDDASTD